MTPHSPYVWHSLHRRWHLIHSITLNHNIYDVTSTSGMTSCRLYQTWHPQYLGHHTLSTDVTPTFDWHHTHLLCDIICAISNITSNPYVITLLYLWHHNLYIWNHIQHAGQHIYYTCDITATICVITPTVETTSHPLFVWHHTRHMCGIVCTIQDITSSLYDLKAPFLGHHNHYIWHHVRCICVITSTVLMIAHQLYLWDHICYNSQHHIHCIWHVSHCICVITPTCSMTSYTFVCMTSLPLYV